MRPGIHVEHSGDIPNEFSHRARCEVNQRSIEVDLKSCVCLSGVEIAPKRIFGWVHIKFKSICRIFNSPRFEQLYILRSHGFHQAWCSMWTEASHKVQTHKSIAYFNRAPKSCNRMNLGKSCLHLLKYETIWVSCLLRSAFPKVHNSRRPSFTPVAPSCACV